MNDMFIVLIEQEIILFELELKQLSLNVLLELEWMFLFFVFFVWNNLQVKI